MKRGRTLLLVSFVSAFFVFGFAGGGFNSTSQLDLGSTELISAFAGPQCPCLNVPEKELLKCLQKNERLQELAWEYKKRGKKRKARKTLEKLRKVLMSNPVQVRWTKPPAKIGGVAPKVEVTFPGGVRGLFKVEGYQAAWGHERHEVAAYEVDQLLEFDFTPMTVWREITLPLGKIVQGSLMYWMNCVNPPPNNAKSDKILFFDAIIGMGDRHAGNWLIMKRGQTPVMIDHNGTFKHPAMFMKHLAGIKNPESLCVYLKRLQSLTPKELDKRVKPFVTLTAYPKFIKALPKIIANLESRSTCN